MRSWSADDTGEPRGRAPLKDALALSLLTTVTGETDLERIAKLTAELQALATVKYDTYEGYRPGVKFIESLAVWLEGFPPEHRAAAVEFVRTRLVYVSAPELDRLVSTVYADLLKPALVEVTAEELSLPSWRVSAITQSPAFLSLRRRMLLLGMSDGARLDRLRRASPLSTEQFHLVTQLDTEKAKDMRTDLEKALVDQGLPGDPTFASVVLVDDFAASGTSMLRRDPDNAESWKGKLIRARRRIDELREDGVVAHTARVTVLVYLMTAAAQGHLESALYNSGLRTAGFNLLPAHVFSRDLPLQEPHDAEFLALCRTHFRPSWASNHTQVGGGEFAIGYGECALPLVLHHNTPNNTPPILWRDELTDPSPEAVAGDRGWVGLFPRHERHHAGRP